MAVWMTAYVGWLLAYVGALNILAFILFAVDKKKARTGKWRISEAMLLVSALAGGALGAVLGMKTFRHKTKHPKFYFGLPLILLLQMTFVFYLLMVGV